MNGTTDFRNPPIVELVLGAQFSPLTKLTSGHYGLFWQELGEDWTEPGDAPLLQDQFELFDRPMVVVPQMLLEPMRLPVRFTLGNRSKDRLLQIQATRFHLNWRKSGGLYPSYERLILEFEEMFNRFATFVKRKRVGAVALNQWELTYIDAFPKTEYWSTPADWATFLPGLFGTLFPTQGLDIALERRAAEWSFEIQPRRGRLHIAAGPGRTEEDKRDAVLLQMTARGPVGEGTEQLRAGLDLGHITALGAFLRLVSDEAKTYFRRPKQ